MADAKEIRALAAHLRTSPSHAANVANTAADALLALLSEVEALHGKSDRYLTKEGLDSLQARLQDMANRTRKHNYSIGDYWNIVDEADDALTALRQRAEQAEAEREAFRKDAERYRWLRKAKLITIEHDNFLLAGVSNLDAACDAAIKERT